MKIMLSQYMKVPLKCVYLMKNPWDSPYVKEQHDKHAF